MRPRLIVFSDWVMIGQCLGKINTIYNKIYSTDRSFNVIPKLKLNVGYLIQNWMWCDHIFRVVFCFVSGGMGECWELISRVCLCANCVLNFNELQYNKNDMFFFAQFTLGWHIYMIFLLHFLFLLTPRITTFSTVNYKIFCIFLFEQAKFRSNEHVYSYTMNIRFIFLAMINRLLWCWMRNAMDSFIVWIYSGCSRRD